MMGHYRSAPNFTAGAKFLREEEIEVASVKIACYVLTFSPSLHEPAVTWWIDKDRYVVRRSEQAGTTTVFTTVKLGEPLAPELFQFVPPPGAKKLDLHQ